MVSKSNYFILLLVGLVLIVSGFTNYFLIFNNNEGDKVTARASDSGQIFLSIEGLDPVPPWIEIVYPEIATYSSGPTSFEYDVYDNNLDTCWYSTDDGVTNNTLIACGINATGMSSSEGINTWYMYVNDTAGNFNSSSVTFYLDSSSGSSSTSSSSGGGGGGGGGRNYDSTEVIYVPSNDTGIKKMEVFPKELEVIVVAGDEISRKLIIANTGKTNISINALVTGIDEIASLNKNKIFLQPGEGEEVILNIKAPDSGIFTGKVRFVSGNEEVSSYVLINVRSSGSLFDVSLTIPEAYKEVNKGDDLRTLVSLLQIGPPFDVDVTVNYFIKDFDDKTLTVESERFSVFKSKNYVHDISDIDLPSGEYVAGVEVIYPGGFSTSSTRFKVTSSFALRNAFFILIIMLLIILIVLLVLKYKNDKTFLVVAKKKRREK